MKIHGQEIPDTALVAGLAVMRGTFTCTQVENAMRPHMPAAPSPERSFIGEAANRLLQRQRRKGAIRYDRASLIWLEVEQ